MAPKDSLPQLLHSLAENLTVEAAERGFMLKSDKLEYGYRFYFPTAGGRGSFNVYYSPRKKRYSIVAPETPDPDLIPLVELAVVKTGAKTPWPEKAEEEHATWEDVFSGNPLLSRHLSDRMVGLQAAGYFVTDFRKLPGGIQLEIAKGETVHKVNLYAGKDKRIKVIPAGKRSKELTAVVKMLLPAGGAKEILPQEERNLKSWLGTDEAGKGDYFGSLVVGGFFADWDVVKELEQMGVVDSKSLSPKRVLSLSRLLWGHFRDRCAVVEIRPERYNQLYSEFRGGGAKLNQLLGWAHAKVIQEIHGRSKVQTVVVDRFGTLGDITRYLKEARSLKLMLRPRAESNPAVAAASILAKARFLERLDKLSEEIGVKLPPGAGLKVIKAGRDVVEKHGADGLHRVAKLHFKTTEKVMEDNGSVDIEELEN